MSRYVTRTNKWFGPKPRLPALDIELTERCPNNCIHCCINLPKDDPAKKHELSTNQLKRILREAAGLGCLQVRFTGGEPLLREDFEEIYIFTRRLGMRVMLFTNARLITPHLADRLAKIPPLLPIEVSVYGMTPDTYDACTRSPGGFREFKKGVESLLQHNVSFVTKWICLPPNQGEVEKFNAWASTLPWTSRSPGINQLFYLRSRRDNPLKNITIRKLRFPPSKIDLAKGIDKFCGNFLGLPEDNLFTCDIGGKPCVDAYGRLQACLSLRTPELAYNLLAGSLNEALELYFKSLCKLKATNPEYLGRCARCFLKGLCEQCPAHAWSENGSIETPVEYLCLTAHAQALALGLIRENEKAWKIKDWKKRLDRLRKECY